MDYAILLLVIAISALYISSTIKKSVRISATPDDWYVVFDIDAEKRVIALWFYPIISFYSNGDETTPITSRPGITKSLSDKRPTNKIQRESGEPSSSYDISMSFGRWVRQGLMFDDFGNPEHGVESSFSDFLFGYLLSDFKIGHGNTVPPFYEQQIKCASNRVEEFLNS